MWLNNSTSPFIYPTLHPGHLVALNTGGQLLLDALLALDKSSPQPRRVATTSHDLFGHVIVADFDGRVLATTPTAPRQANTTTIQPAVKSSPEEIKTIRQSFIDDWKTKGMITVEGRKHVFINSVPTSCRAGQPEFLLKQMTTFMLGAKLPVDTSPGGCCVGMLTNDLLYEVFNHLRQSVDYPKIAVGAARGNVVGLIVGMTRRCIIIGVYTVSMCPEPYLSTAMLQLSPFMDAVVECGW